MIIYHTYFTNLDCIFCSISGDLTCSKKLDQLSQYFKMKISHAGMLKKLHMNYLCLFYFSFKVKLTSSSVSNFWHRSTLENHE